MNEDQVRAVLARMDVPEHKRDVSKPTTVKWLLLNLRARNYTHPDYVEVISFLAATAIGGNYVTKSERKQIEEHIDIATLEAFLRPEAHQPDEHKQERSHLRPKISVQTKVREREL